MEDDKKPTKPRAKDFARQPAKARVKEPGQINREMVMALPRMAPLSNLAGVYILWDEAGGVVDVGCSMNAFAKTRLLEFEGQRFASWSWLPCHYSRRQTMERRVRLALEQG